MADAGSALTGLELVLANAGKRGRECRYFLTLLESSIQEPEALSWYRG